MHRPQNSLHCPKHKCNIPNPLSSHFKEQNALLCSLSFEKSPICIAPIDSDALKHCHVLQKDYSPANNHQLHQYQLQWIPPKNPLHFQEVNEANAKFPNIVLAFLNCNASATIDHSIPKIAFQMCRNSCLNSKPIAFQTCPNSCYSNQNCIPNVSQFMSKHISRIEIYNI